VRTNGLLIGLVFLMSSFCIFFIPAEDYTFAIYNIFYLLFGLGVIFICDYIDLKLSGSSLLVNKKNVSFLRGFGIAAGTLGVFMDIFIQLLAKMWVFNKIQPWFYIIFLFFGFIFYFEIIAESYFATKSILDKIFKKPKLKSIENKKLGSILKPIFVISILIVIFSSIYYGIIYYLRGGYFHNFGKTTDLNTSLVVPIFLSLALWGIAEFIAFRKNKNSLIKNMLRGYYRPLMAIFLTCLWLGLLMELWNVPVEYWAYNNMPFLDVHIFGIPIIVLLLWPLHYIPFLSWYNVFSEKLPEDPWEIDKIKS